MSRAININADQNAVTTMCGKHAATISTIETLHSGGTRVVLHNGHDAAVIAKAFGGKVLTGPVTRTPTRLATQR